MILIGALCERFCNNIIPMYMTVWFGSVSMEYYHDNYYCPVVQLDKSHIKWDSPCSTYNTLDATCTSD